MAEERIINGYRVRRNDDGSFTTLGPVGQSAQPPVDPAFQYKGPQAQGNALDNRVTEATLPSVVRKTNADATAAELKLLTEGAPAGYRWKSATDHSSVVPLQGYVDPKAPPPKTDEDRASVRAEAVDKIKLARSLVDRSKNGWFTTGFGSGIAGSFKGSPAYDLAQDTDTLKNAGALTRIMEMSAQNGGKNPLTPLSNADFQALASSLSNLEPGQSDEQYQRNIQRVIDLYQRAYQGAGGTDLEGDIDPSKRRPQAPTMLPLGSPGDGSGGGAGGPGGNGPGSVWQQTYGTGSTAPGAAPAGSTTQAQPIDPRMQAELDAYIQQNGRNINATDFNRYITGLYARYGARPGPGLDEYAAQTANALQRGGQINSNIPAQTVPLSGLNRLRNDVVNNPVGAGVVGFGDALGMGAVSALAGDDVRALGNASTGNTLGMMAGQIAGSVAGTRGLGMMGRASIGRAAPSLLGGGGRAQFARDLGTDAVYSGVYGTAQGQDPLASVALGVGGSLAGRGLGRFGAAVAGRDPLNAGQRAVLNALPNDATDALSQAQSMGLPMSLADVSPEIASLTGAAIRRNPTVAGQARDTLTRRNLGQIDRFRTAVSDNLGPLDNVPQRADDITARARAQAGPLYDQAYATPVPASPELEGLLNTPFGRQAISRSRTIAANERRSPTELGFAEDASGNVVLNPVPNDLVARHLMARNVLDEAQSAHRAGRGVAGYDNAAGLERITAARQGLRDAEAALDAAPTPGQRASVPTYTTQSLDYAKRGMDDILEEQRNQITGKLNLDEMGRSQNDVRQGLLREIDRSNPAYGQARAAYAGPAGEREALHLGRQALTEQPDLLAIQVGRQTPERLDMMRLGARDRLAQGASELSNSTNPYRTINTPAMEQRLTTLYGDDATRGLMAQRDAELRMANTSNNLIGNSMTPERLAADRAFADEGFLRPIVEGGIETAVTGAPVTTVLRRLGGQRLGDAAKMGFGKKAERKAAQIGALTLNTAPDDVLRALGEARALDEQFKTGLSAARRRYGGMFGRGLIPVALRLGAGQ